jgi:transposase InsO family protein
MYQDL